MNHAHHLPDPDTPSGAITLPAAVRLQSHAGGEDHDRYRAMTLGEVAAVEGTAEVAEEADVHPLLHPRITGAVDVLTLSGIDQDEMIPG